MDRATPLTERGTGLVQRLFDAFAKQVDDIEGRIAADEVPTGDDLKVLSGLAKTLETLMQLAQRTASADEAPDIDMARAELSDRIGSLLSEHSLAHRGVRAS